MFSSKIMKSAKSSVVHDHVTGHFNICNGDAALHLMPNKLSSNNSLYQKSLLLKRKVTITVVERYEVRPKVTIII